MQLARSVIFALITFVFVACAGAHARERGWGMPTGGLNPQRAASLEGVAGVHDEPYMEVASFRMTTADVEEPVLGPDWGVLPFDGPIHQLMPLTALGAAAASSDTQQGGSAAGVAAWAGNDLFVALLGGARNGANNATWASLFENEPLTSFTRVALPTGSLVTGARLAQVGAITIVASPTSVQVFHCTSSLLASPRLRTGAGDAAMQCATAASVDAALGFVNDTAVVRADTTEIVLWIASANGIWRVGGSSGNLAVQRVAEDSTWSVAYSAALGQVAAGNSEKLFLYTESPTPTLQRWEWVSMPDGEVGGPIDSAVTALAYDDSIVGNGTLYIGGAESLNIRDPNGTIWRIDGMRGLPYGNISSLEVQAATSAAPKRGFLWAATSGGVWRADLDATTPRAPSDPPRPTPSTTDAGAQFRMFYGPRYLPPQAFSAATGLVVLTNDTVVVSTAVSGPATSDTTAGTGGGIAMLQTQWWTLAKKARWFEGFLPVLDRYGLLAECMLSGFAAAGSCTGNSSYPSDNSGSFTAIVAAAEAFRYAVTGDPHARDAALTYYGGLRSLNRITGTRGFFARTFVGPGKPHPSDGIWFNSTVPEWAGFTWKGDTSSDEVTRHMWAYNVMAQLVSVPGAPPPANHTEVTEIAADIASYIVRNGFFFVEPSTGRPTKWGRWAPSVLNFNRSWADDRGVNSVEILSYICTGANYTGDPDGEFAAAYDELVNSTNQYHINVLNEKIEWPLDVNYGDDGLGYSALWNHLTLCGSDDWVERNGPIWAAARRHWEFVRWIRSAEWNSFVALLTGTLDQYDADSVAWNLRSWPLESIDYPVVNSHRIDLLANAAPPTWARGSDRGRTVDILPANERLQYR